MPTLAIALLALVGCLAPIGAAAATDEVAVRAGIHPDFGRLALEWPGPVEVEPERHGDRLVLRFDRPFTADLAIVPVRLGDYLDGIEIAADGRAAVLRMVAGVRAKLEVHDGRVVVVDLSSEAEAPTDVAIRTGEHDGYARLVFDWAGPIEFETEHGDQALRLRFARLGRIETTTITDHLSAWLLRASTTTVDGGTEVGLALRPEVRAEVLEVGTDLVVVDLYGPGAPPDPPSTNGGATPPADALTSRSEASGPEAGRQVMADLGSPLAAGVLTRADAAEPAEGAGKGAVQAWIPAPSPPAPRPMVTADSSDTPAAPAAASPVEDPPQPQADRREPATPMSAGGAGQAAAAVPDEVPVAAAATSLAATEAPAPADAEPSGRGKPPVRLVFRGEPGPGGGALGFAWSRPVGAAVLIRAGFLWTVFDLPVGRLAELPSFAAGLDEVLGPGEPVDAAGGIAIRFPLLRPLGARAERSDARWRIVLGPEPIVPEAVAALRQRDPDRLKLLVDEVVRPVRVRDPEVGDQLEFWPLRVPGRGLPRAQRLVDLELLRSAQGLVWRPLTDGIESVVLDHGIEVAPPHGPTIAIGPEPAAAASPEAPIPDPTVTPGDDAAPPPPRTGLPEAFRRAGNQAPPPVGPLALADWGTPDAATFRHRRGQLLHRLADQPPDQRGPARLDLARLFLGQAMAAETLAVLEVITEDEGADAAEDEGDQPLRVARQGLAGAAELLLGRLERARSAFADPALADEPEIALWRAVLAAAEEDWGRAALELGRSDRTLDSYPPRLQLRLGLPAALIALEAGRHDLARSLLRHLQRLAEHPIDQARVGFALGLAAARGGAIREADEIWRELERAPDYETRVKAAYARVTMLLDGDGISPEEALARLGPIAALWRGHPWEATMLDGLARIHLQSGDPPGAIRTWRDLVRRHPDSTLAATAKTDMQASFEATLLAEDAGALGAVRAYALYRDFPELVPDGAAGIDLRRRLAGQLSELDLIEPAAHLLEQVIAGQAAADQRAATAVELAALRLAQPDPEATLAVLDGHPMTAGGTADLGHRRRLLRAQALAALDRPRAALDLLAGDPSAAAGELAVEIAWRARDWPRLVAAIEPHLAAAEAAERPLTDTDQEWLLKLAIAHGHRGDGLALARLRTRFGPALRGRALEPAFLMATMPTDRPPAPEAVLALAGTQLGEVRRYLEQPLPAR